MPTVGEGLTAGQQHKQEQRLRLHHLLQPAQHGRPQNVIEHSDSINTQNCGCGTGVRGSEEKVSNTIRAGSSRQGVLERCVFLLDMRTELFGQSSRNKTSKRASSCNTSNSAIFLLERGQPCTHHCRCDGTWDFRLCQSGGCLVQKFKSVFLVHHDLEVFTSAPAWPWRRTAWGCFEALQELVAVQFQRHLRDLSDVVRQRYTSRGRLLCNSLNVSRFPGARAAPARHCRARDTSPNCTFRQRTKRTAQQPNRQQTKEFPENEFLCNTPFSGVDSAYV